MSVQRNAPEGSEADTVLSESPVHVRRWTARPRAVELLVSASWRLSHLLRKASARAAAWLQAASALVAGHAQALRLTMEAGRLERRRSPLLRELGRAAYAGDRAGSRRLKKQLAELDLRVERLKAAAGAFRAASRRQARQALDSARATQVREPDAGRDR